MLNICPHFCMGVIGAACHIFWGPAHRLIHRPVGVNSMLTQTPAQVAQIYTKPKFRVVMR
ncbi:MAG: hypothetical protein QOH05_4903 [Acetobacteraceae bacterium]|jgi:hypothetical protein|nr:hypothetical protein [Acetobacteraceae bacterium]